MCGKELCVTRGDLVEYADVSTRSQLRRSTMRQLISYNGDVWEGQNQQCPKKMNQRHTVELA